MWLTFLIRSLIAFVAAPAITYQGVKGLIKHSGERSGKIWLAVSSSAYSVLAIMMGMAMGGAAAQALSSALSLPEFPAWFLFITGAVISLGLSILAILKVYSRMRVRQE